MRLTGRISRKGKKTRITIRQSRFAVPIAAAGPTWNHSRQNKSRCGRDARTRNVARGRAALITLGATLGVAWQSPAAADTVRLVTPFAAGGPADLLARLLAQGLREHLRADLVVGHRGGGGGVLGTEAVARAAPDGKTLLLGSLGSHVISAALRAQLSYDPRKSFDPLVLIGSVPSVLVVGSQLEAASLGE